MDMEKYEYFSSFAQLASVAFFPPAKSTAEYEYFFSSSAKLDNLCAAPAQLRAGESYATSPTKDSHPPLLPPSPRWETAPPTSSAECAEREKNPTCNFFQQKKNFFSTHAKLKLARLRAVTGDPRGRLVTPQGTSAALAFSNLAIKKREERRAEKQESRLLKPRLSLFRATLFSRKKPNGEDDLSS